MPNRKALWALAKVAFVVCVVGLLVLVLHGIGFSEIIEAMQDADAEAVRAAVLLQFGTLLLWTFRWQLLMPREERKSILILFPIYMAGVFGNLITPGARVGGEPIRAYYMSTRYGGEKTHYLGTILTDKVGNSVVSLVFSLAAIVLALLLLPLAVAVKAALLAPFLLLTAAIVSGFLMREKIGLRSAFVARMLSIIYNGRLMAFVRRQFPTYEHFEKYILQKMDNVFSPIRRAAVSPKAITKIVLTGVASYVLFYLAHYLLFRGLGVQLSMLEVFIIVGIAVLCGDMAISPGGAGFMEAAMIGLCVALEVDSDKAAAVTLISRGIFFALGLGLGGLCLLGLSLFYGRSHARTAAED